MNKEQQATNNKQNSIRAFLVEDDSGYASLIRKILARTSSFHYELTHAVRLSDALKQLEQDSCDIILLDLTLPDSWGIDTFRKIQACAPHIPIIILTGMEDENLGFQIVQEGAQDYLVKGQASIDFFNRSISYAIHRKRIEWELKQQRELVTQQARELEEALSIQRHISDNLIHTAAELKAAKEQVEQQNITLAASNRKLEDLNNTKEQLMRKIGNLHEAHFLPLQNLLKQINPSDITNLKDTLSQVNRQIYQIDEILQPITSLYVEEQYIQNKRVLLAEPNKKQQLLAKMALGGTGVDLDIVSDLETGRVCLNQHSYDILYITHELIELVSLAHSLSPKTRSVLVTSAPPTEYLPLLRQYPYLSNIVSRSGENRSFEIKNILTTISKLITQDLFGLEKYLNWGVEVQQRPILHSGHRVRLTEDMITYFSQLGIRRSIWSKMAMISEELLMNAIYDAPVDAKGKSLYNHLSRTVEIELNPNEQGLLRYACDGMSVAVSVEDPFGALSRDTLINYLESCYQGQAGTLNAKKGGAGRGLFQIIETADLMIVNVKPGIKTEVIVILNIDHHRDVDKATSLHYFSS